MTRRLISFFFNTLNNFWKETQLWKEAPPWSFQTLAVKQFQENLNQTSETKQNWRINRHSTKNIPITIFLEILYLSMKSLINLKIIWNNYFNRLLQKFDQTQYKQRLNVMRRLTTETLLIKLKLKNSSQSVFFNHFPVFFFNPLTLKI